MKRSADPERLLRLPLLPTKQRVHKRWARTLEAVDTRFSNGFAFVGRYLKPGDRVPFQRLRPVACFPQDPVVLEVAEVEADDGDRHPLARLLRYDVAADKWRVLGEAAGSRWARPLIEIALGHLPTRKRPDQPEPDAGAVNGDDSRPRYRPGWGPDGAWLGTATARAIFGAKGDFDAKVLALIAWAAFDHPEQRWTMDELLDHCTYDLDCSGEEVSEALDRLVELGALSPGALPDYEDDLVDLSEMHQAIAEFLGSREVEKRLVAARGLKQALADYGLLEKIYELKRAAS